MITRTGAVGAAQWAADTVGVVPADGTVMLANGDPQRAAVTVINDTDSTGDVWLVPNSGQARGGARLIPGAGLVIASVAPVYGYIKTGGATVYLVNETGVAC